MQQNPGVPLPAVCQRFQVANAFESADQLHHVHARNCGVASSRARERQYSSGSSTCLIKRLHPAVTYGLEAHYLAHTITHFACSRYQLALCPGCIAAWRTWRGSSRVGPEPDVCWAPQAWRRRSVSLSARNTTTRRYCPSSRALAAIFVPSSLQSGTPELPSWLALPARKPL